MTNPPRKNSDVMQRKGAFGHDGQSTKPILCGITCRLPLLFLRQMSNFSLYVFFVKKVALGTSLF